MEDEKLIVDGFVFPSFSEAQNAIKEKKNIEVIKERTPVDNPDALFELYCKLIERKMFKTMVGYSFLYDLRIHLLNCGFPEEKLPLIVIPKKMDYNIVERYNNEAAKTKLEELTVSKKRMGVVIIGLTVLVLSMFIIAIINPNAGYINTENKVLNKYAAWEEELSERERVVKEKEIELHIGNEDENLTEDK